MTKGRFFKHLFKVLGISNEPYDQFVALYKLILTQRKFELFTLFIGAIISGIIEIVGIVLLYLLLRVLINISGYSEDHIVISTFRQIGVVNRDYIVPIFGVSILSIFILKNIYILFYYNYQSYLLKAWKQETSFMLMKKYLMADYSLLLGYNSATIIRNINSTTIQVINGFLLSILNYFANLITGTFIIAVLFAKFFYLTFGISVLLMISTKLQNLFLRKKFRALGEEREKLSESQNKNVYQGFHAIKETRIIGCEDYFLKEFKVGSEAAIENESKMLFFSRVSSHITEIVVIFGVLLICGYILLNHRSDMSGTVATLGVLAGIAFRVAPTMNKSISAMQGIHKTIPSVRIFLNEIRKLSHIQIDQATNRTRERLAFKDKVQFQNVSCRYPKAGQNALSEVSVDIAKGSIVGIVGHSGAGKTTFVEVLMGLLPPIEGQILVDDFEISQGSVRSWQNCIGYVPQHVFLSDDTIAKNIAFGTYQSEIKMEKVETILKQLGLAELSPSFIVGENGKNLSGGQRQRIGIARALYLGAEVLIFDEATSALDVMTEKEIMDLLYSLRGEITTIIVAHRLSTVFKADNILLFDTGRIVADGSFLDLYQSNLKFKEMADIAKIYTV